MSIRTLCRAALLLIALPLLAQAGEAPPVFSCKGPVEFLQIHPHSPGLFQGTMKLAHGSHQTLNCRLVDDGNFQCYGFDWVLNTRREDGLSFAVIEFPEKVTQSGVVYKAPPSRELGCR